MEKCPRTAEMQEVLLEIDVYWDPVEKSFECSNVMIFGNIS
jgi:hypothetical protein